MTLPLDDAPARMNQMYRHQRRIYDLTRRYYLLGRTHLVGRLAPPTGGTILEVGCGTASNLIEAAARYPTAKLYGFDISTEMLATAAQSIKKRGFADRITLAPGDATQFDTQRLFGVSAIDRVFTSYTVSMIPGWPRVLAEMARTVAPGGAMHLVDFGDCAGLPPLAKTLLYGWLAKFDVSPRLDLQRELQTCATTHGLTLDYKPLFRGYAQYAELKRRPS